eukprot:80868-Rhodomonas_salina.1
MDSEQAQEQLQAELNAASARTDELELALAETRRELADLRTSEMVSQQDDTRSKDDTAETTEMVMKPDQTQETIPDHDQGNRSKLLGTNKQVRAVLDELVSGLLGVDTRMVASHVEEAKRVVKNVSKKEAEARARVAQLEHQLAQRPSDLASDEASRRFMEEAVQLLERLVEVLRQKHRRIEELEERERGQTKPCVVREYVRDLELGEEGYRKELEAQLSELKREAGVLQSKLEEEEKKSEQLLNMLAEGR